MKKLSLIICSIFFVFIVNAQTKILSYGIGPVASFPVGDFGNAAGVGFGGEIHVDYPLTKHFEAFGQGGFQSFIGKSIAGVSNSTVSAPSFIFGTRYYINNFHVGLGIGYTSFIRKYDEDGVSLSPQVGIRISNFNLIAHYTLTNASGGNLPGGSNHYNIIGLKLIYKLSNIFENSKMY